MGKWFLLLILLKIIHLFFNWDNDQASLHPFVCYNRRGTELDHIILIVISDCLKHDTDVHLFQRNLVKMLKNKINFDLKKLIYFSDGAASHKNYKNFVNLWSYKADFGTDADWHFFATSHGKGPCDGLGGTVKRLAAKASLQWPYNEQIMTPWQLFDFVRENFSGINTVYCSMDEWKNEADILEERFYHSTSNYWCHGSISLEAILVLPKYVVNFGFYAVV